MASDQVAGTPALVLFATERSTRHQQLAIDAAPDNLRVVMLRDPDTLVSHLADARFLISERVGLIDSSLVDAAPGLELIVRLGSFSFDIDLDAAKRAGVIVCRWPLSGAMRVAEHLVLQMLALTRRLPMAQSAIVRPAGRNDHSEEGIETAGESQTRNDNQIRSRRTDENTFAFNWSNVEGLNSLHGKTIGILGFGEIGAELARRLHGWGCTLLYYKRRRLPESVEGDLGVAYATREILVAGSDVVVNLLPYSPETDMSIDATLLEQMKDGACLVSCGSGATVDEEAAGRAVESGRLSGLAMDTFEWEPIKPGNLLVNLASLGHNVVLTPHIAGGSRAAAAEERQGYYTSITNHLSERPIRYRLV